MKTLKKRFFNSTLSIAPFCKLNPLLKIKHNLPLTLVDFSCLNDFDEYFSINIVGSNGKIVEENLVFSPYYQNSFTKKAVRQFITSLLEQNARFNVVFLNGFTYTLTNFETEKLLFNKFSARFLRRKPPSLTKFGCNGGL